MRTIKRPHYLYIMSVKSGSKEPKCSIKAEKYRTKNRDLGPFLNNILRILSDSS